MSLVETTRADKRAAIDAALLADPMRSDREIGRSLGVDHKTVSGRRGKIKNPQVGKLDRGNSPTSEELLLLTLPHIDPEAPVFKADLAKVEKITAQEAAREKLGINDEPEELPLLLRQREITIAHDERMGEWIIRQKNWPDDDAEIRILDERMSEFLDNLTDRMGVLSIRGSG